MVALVASGVVHRTGLHIVRHHADAPGPPVVLVHGAPDRSKSFAHSIHRLTDLQVVAYDRRGYGKSLAAGEQGGGFATHARDLVDILDGTPSVVVGHSAGGAVAMAAATLAPELFLALGVWEPPMVPWPFWPEDRRRITLDWIAFDDTDLLGESVTRMMLGDSVWDGLSERTRQLLRAEGRAFHADMASQVEPFFDISALRVPRVLGCGTAEAWQRTIFLRCAEATGCEAIVVEGASHYVHTSDPATWASFVRATAALAAPDWATTGS
jgi:pimeloyl-ACP methyl ester carboxylesterase